MTQYDNGTIQTILYLNYISIHTCMHQTYLTLHIYVILKNNKDVPVLGS